MINEKASDKLESFEDFGNIEDISEDDVNEGAVQRFEIGEPGETF